MYGNVISAVDAIFISIFSMSAVFIVLLVISYMIDIVAFFVNKNKSKRL